MLLFFAVALPWYIAVQFHPEARPGPTDTDYLFDEFVGTLGHERKTA